VEQAKDNLEEGEARLNRNEITDKQVRTLRRQLEDLRLALDKVRLEGQVYEKYTKPLQETDLRAKVVEAQKTMERTEQKAKSTEAQARLDLEAKKAVYEGELARHEEIKQEIQKCKLHAPRDGMVLFYVPEQHPFAGTQQSVVAVGEPVREGQKLMYIPDLGKMQVVIHVPDTLIAHIGSNMSAIVRIDSIPDRAFNGQVGQVAPAPWIRHSLAANERTYATTIPISGDTAGLRPGMSATVTVPFGKPLENVLMVPVRSLIGRASPGTTVSCLVMTADGPAEREVIVGLLIEDKMEIRSGLREGDEVIVNPRLLLNQIQDRIQFVRGQ
jgi:multidrug efflux pump subunit AcrA (membrane-fusion protein)